MSNAAGPILRRARIIDGVQLVHCTEQGQGFSKSLPKMMGVCSGLPVDCHAPPFSRWKLILGILSP